MWFLNPRGRHPSKTPTTYQALLSKATQVLLGLFPFSLFLLRPFQHLDFKHLRDRASCLSQHLYHSTAIWILPQNSVMDRVAYRNIGCPFQFEYQTNNTLFWKCMSHAMFGIYLILKNGLLIIWNSNLTGGCIFLLAKSCNLESTNLGCKAHFGHMWMSNWAAYTTFMLLGFLACRMWIIITFLKGGQLKINGTLERLMIFFSPSN